MLGKKLLSLTFCCLIGLVGTISAQETSLTGEQIVKKMAAQYAVAKSYQDIGIAQRIASDGSTVLASEPAVYFKTYFDRPNRFRFEWENQVTSKSWSILWSDGADVYAKWAQRGPEKQANLDVGITGATALSLGAARLVPNLLMREVSGFRLTQMQRVTRLRDEKVGDELCFVVRGHHPYGFQIDLWISKTDFMLRKEREKNDDGSYNEELRSDIKTNGDIPSETFQFRPVQKGELIAQLISR